MEKEISGGAMLGIVLIALAAVIGLGFGVFSIAKGIANEGVVNVQESLNTVSESAFLDYDQKVVTGTQVVSALKTFQGKAVSILIGTKALMGNQTIAPASDHAEAYLVGDGTTTYLNYNAIIAVNAAGQTGGKIIGGTAKTAVVAGTGGVTVVPVTFDNRVGAYTVNNGFALLSGNVLFDTATAGIFKSGNAEYIPSSTKFQAYLLKDASGTTVGIAFKQL